MNSEMNSEMNMPLPFPAHCPAADYQALLGDKAWNTLHPAIRRRFDAQNYHVPVTYEGEMQEVYLSAPGMILAHVLRLIGTPLALYKDKNVPMTVEVYPDHRRKGMVWDRFYHYKKHAQNRVKSTKCIDLEKGLMELVGAGFGMFLKLGAEEGALVFTSQKFFWKLGKVSVGLPQWLAPGKTIVKQRALDHERFEFTLEVKHQWFGLMYYQQGIFEAI